MLILYFVVLGLAAGRLAGGHVRPLEQVRFRWWGLALGGLGFQVLLFSEPVGHYVGSATPALYVGSTLVVLAALLRNLGLPGFTLIALGAGLNLVAILANGGHMPSSLAVRLEVHGSADLGGRLTNSVLEGPDTLVPWLGDIFALPRPFPFANAFSIGDVVIGLGIVLFLVRTMRAHETATPRQLQGA